MSFESKWHFVEVAVAGIMSKWRMALDIEQQRYKTEVCRECGMLSTIIDTHAEIGRCRCCGQEYEINKLFEP